MKKLIVFISLISITITLFGQCADEYEGIYYRKSCSLPNEEQYYSSDTSVITSINENQIKISNFMGIPNDIIFQEDSIIGNLFCDEDSVILSGVNFYISEYVYYGGYGYLYDDSITIFYSFASSSQFQDFCITYVKDYTTNISQVDKYTSFIYPNPANEYVVINSHELGLKSGKIYNLSGQLIKQFKVDNSRYRIEISDLKSGVYFVKVGEQIQKLVVE